MLSERHSSNVSENKMKCFEAVIDLSIAQFVISENERIFRQKDAKKRINANFVDLQLKYFSSDSEKSFLKCVFTNMLASKAMPSLCNIGTVPKEKQLLDCRSVNMKVNNRSI